MQNSELQNSPLALLYDLTPHSFTNLVINFLNFTLPLEASRPPGLPSGSAPSEATGGSAY